MDWTQWVGVLRDIAIIIMGLLVGLAGLAVAVFVWVLYGRVMPLLDSLRTTLTNVQGTTAFLGEQAVAPVIRTVGFVNGVRRGFQFLGGIVRRGR